MESFEGKFFLSHQPLDAERSADSRLRARLWPHRVSASQPLQNQHHVSRGPAAFGRFIADMKRPRSLSGRWQNRQWGSLSSGWSVRTMMWKSLFFWFIKVIKPDFQSSKHTLGLQSWRVHKKCWLSVSDSLFLQASAENGHGDDFCSAGLWSCRSGGSERRGAYEQQI